MFAPYIQHFIASVRGMGDADYGQLQSIYYLTVVALEVPSGVVADRLGRRWTLAIGAFGAALGSFGCAMAQDYTVFAVAEILLAVGTAFISGADSALLYDSLAADGKEHEYPRAEAAAQALWLTTSAIGFLFVDATLFATESTDPTFTYWVSGGLMAIGVGLALAMREPERQRQSTRQITFGAIGDVVRSPGILRLVVYSLGVFALLRMAIVMFFNPSLDAAGLPVHLYGTVLAVVNAVGATAAWKAGKQFDKHIRLLMVGMPVALVVMFGGIAFGAAGGGGVGVAILFCIQGAAFGIYPLVIRAQLNQLVPSAARRATILSLESLTCRLAFAPIATFSGWTLEHRGLRTGMLLSVAVACLPFLLVPWLPRRRP